MSTTSLQLKLRGIFFSDDSSSNDNNAIGDIFFNVITTITNFFQHLINLFNQKLPPDTRDEQIHHFLDGATPYLIGVVVFIAVLCCWSCIFSCISYLVMGLFLCISFIVVGIFQVIWSVFRGIFGCIRWCLCCGTRSATKMMKAPGRPSIRLPRSAFEGNPRGYFRSLRGKTNNFVY